MWFYFIFNGRIMIPEKLLVKNVLRLDVGTLTNGRVTSGCTRVQAQPLNIYKHTDTVNLNLRCTSISHCYTIVENHKPCIYAGLHTACDFLFSVTLKYFRGITQVYGFHQNTTTYYYVYLHSLLQSFIQTFIQTSDRIFIVS